MRSTYPESAHVEQLGLLGAADRVVWDKAREGGFVLVTKDGDFQRLSVMLGPPPKVVWLRRGNAPTADVARVLEANAEAIAAFVEDPDLAFLAIE